MSGNFQLKLHAHNQLDNLVSQDSNGPVTPEPEPREEPSDEDPLPGPSRQNNTFEGRINGHRNSSSVDASGANNFASNSSVANGSATNGGTSSVRSSSYKLVILKESTGKAEIEEKLNQYKTRAVLESLNFFNESHKEAAFDHDYSVKPKLTKQQKAERERARRQERQRLRQTIDVPDDDEDEDEEAEENQGAENEDDLDSSDCSLDESDFSSSESTTEVSSEHSDWGSDDQENGPPPTKATSELVPEKKKSPKNKRRRNAANLARERLLNKQGEISDEFMPSPWLSESIPRKSPYFPQIGDILMYFKNGHQKYLDLVIQRKVYKVDMKEQLWKKKALKEPCKVRIVGIKFEIRPPRLCVSQVRSLEREQRKTNWRKIYD